MKIIETQAFKQANYAPLMHRQPNTPGTRTHTPVHIDAPKSGNAQEGILQVKQLMQENPKAAWDLLQKDVRYRQTTPEENQECEQLAQQIKPLLRKPGFLSRMFH